MEKPNTFWLLFLTGNQRGTNHVSPQILFLPQVRRTCGYSETQPHHLKTCKSLRNRRIRWSTAKPSKKTIHLYSWYGSKKLFFLQTPVKMNRIKQLKETKYMPRTVKDSFENPPAGMAYHGRKRGLGRAHSLAALVVGIARRHGHRPVSFADAQKP